MRYAKDLVVFLTKSLDVTVTAEDFSLVFVTINPGTLEVRRSGAQM